MAEAPPLTLIYLDVDDEITSAAARIRAAGAEEVALVVPYGSRLATSRINFRLLAREAAERGKKIEIVCADASARALAVAAGLPTHASVAALEAARSGLTPTEAADVLAALGLGTEASAGTSGGASGPWSARTPETAGAGVPTTDALAGPAAEASANDTRTRVLATPRRKPPKVPIVGPPRPPMPTRTAVAIGLAVIATIIAAGLLALEYLPAATITLHPRSESIGPLQLSVEARADVTEPDPAVPAIPARSFTFPLQATQTFAATGIKVEQVKATGNVTFSNFDTGGAERIDAGSIVSTDAGVQFKTLANVTLPHATIQFPFTIVPSTSTVDVEAVKAGPDGNVGNNTITHVPPGHSGRLLAVTNVEATTGGARNELPEVSADDVEAARAALQEALIADLDRQVAAGVGVPAGYTLFPLTRTVGEAQYSVDPATLAGTAGESFDLGATAVGSVLGVDSTPIQGVAEARLAGRLTAGWSILPGSVTTTIGTPVVLGSTIAYPVTVVGIQVHDVDEKALIAEIRGLNLAAARSRLDDFGDVEIEVWPEWVTKIPSRDDRVTFNLAEPQASVAP